MTTKAKLSRWWANYTVKPKLLPKGVNPEHSASICVFATNKQEAEKILTKRHHAKKVITLRNIGKADDWYLERWWSIDQSSYLQAWRPNIKTSEMIGILIKKYPNLADRIIQ